MKLYTVNYKYVKVPNVRSATLVIEAEDVQTARQLAFDALKQKYQHFTITKIEEFKNEQQALDL